MRRLLAADRLCASFEPLMDAAAAAYGGRWVEAASGFRAALKPLAAELGRRHNLMSSSLMQWYVIPLLAHPDAAAWTAARKLCVAESGTRTPSVYEARGRWAHAIAVRLVDARFDPVSAKLIA